jgi:hypothetical protein
MLKNVLTLAICTLTAFHISAQDYSLLAGARSEGFAHATVAVEDVFSTFHNPSLLAWNDQNYVGLSGRNHFLVSTMNSGYGVGAFRAGNGNAGFNFKYEGSSTYYNLRAGGYYAMHFGEILAASVGLNLYQHRIQGYDASFAFTADVGLTGNFDKLKLGFYWGNVNQGEYTGTFTENIPNYLRFGGAYYILENFIISLEGLQELGEEFGARGGIEYTIEEILAIRFGYSSLPRQTSMGVSLYINEFSIDMAGSWHPMLGFSPHIGATYRW